MSAIYCLFDPFSIGWCQAAIRSARMFNPHAAILLLARPETADIAGELARREGVGLFSIAFPQGDQLADLLLATTPWQRLLFTKFAAHLGDHAEFCVLNPRSILLHELRDLFRMLRAADADALFCGYQPLDYVLPHPSLRWLYGACLPAPASCHATSLYVTRRDPGFCDQALEIARHIGGIRKMAGWPKEEALLNLLQVFGARRYLNIAGDSEFLDEQVSEQISPSAPHFAAANGCLYSNWGALLPGRRVAHLAWGEAEITRSLPGFDVLRRFLGKEYHSEPDEAPQPATVAAS
jgi:hypothetical protein